MPPHPGGGGLVILPHKSWNVWNQDNKEKVARDEKANAQLIAAKDKCRKTVLQQIRFERLTGQTITEQEQETRIKHALETMDINDYITNKSMQDIAKNMNDKMQREQFEKDSNTHTNSKKRKYKSVNHNLSQEQIKYGPRKRHKRNDVSIIEDHYSHKSKFEFDPKQYNSVNDKQNRFGDTNNNKKVRITDIKIENNPHFSLFNERDLRNKSNRNGYKNQENIKEERRKKELEECRFNSKLGKTEIDTRRKRKPWYLMTSEREINRRLLMKSDESQYSLPRKYKDYDRNTNELEQKVRSVKEVNDPMLLMNEYLRRQKDMNQREKKGKARQKKRGKSKRYCSDSDGEYEERHKKKKTKRKHHKSDKHRKKKINAGL